MNKVELWSMDKYFTDPEMVADDIYLLSQKRTVTPSEFYKMNEIEQDRVFILMKRIECDDGFSMSVQANYSSYCSPRITIRNTYTNFYNEYEVGFPNQEEELLKQYAEDKGDLTNTVYPYVPKEIIEQVIKKHGGIKTTNP